MSLLHVAKSPEETKLGDVLTVLEGKFSIIEETDVGVRQNICIIFNRDGRREAGFVHGMAADAYTVNDEMISRQICRETI